MGLSYRKSRRLGPFRVNVSGRGVGVSAGARGARVSTNTRGRSLLSLSFHGLRYVARIGRR